MPTSAIFCIVPSELARQLQKPLVDHFARHSGVQVVVESRARERRVRQRRNSSQPVSIECEHRTIHAAQGRRVADRRAAQTPVSALPLPRRAQRHADRIRFVVRVVQSAERIRDRGLAYAVIRVQGGDRRGLEDIYLLALGPLYGYLRVLLRNAHDAEDATHEVFANAIEALPRFELRNPDAVTPWLFQIARHEALRRLRHRKREEVEEDDILDVRRSAIDDTPAQVPGWLSDADLLCFIERLPLAQRQVITLRYLADLDTDEIAAILDRTPQAIRHLQARGLAFLRSRLEAIGRTGGEVVRVPTLAKLRRIPVVRQRRFALTAHTSVRDLIGHSR